MILEDVDMKFQTAVGMVGAEAVLLCCILFGS
jgi:hypothetical protein